MSARDSIQLASAVLLILSSIALAAYQVIDIQDVAGGVLMYIAQAFLLAASIFGLDYYVNIFNSKLHGHARHPEQQPTEHPQR